MSKILDSRVVEDAEAIRIVIYPNVEREKPIELPSDWEKLSSQGKVKWRDEHEPEYEYYDNVVTTYKLKDNDGDKLLVRNIEHEFGLSDEKNTIMDMQTNLGKDLEIKLTKDINMLTVEQI